MTTLVTIENHGPLIAKTNFWSTVWDEEGYYLLSPNAGVLRILVPSVRSVDIAEMRTAKEIVVRMGHDQREKRHMTEILFDDRTPGPFVLYISDEQWQHMPAEGDFPRPIEVTVWEGRRGEPHKVLGRPGWLDRSELPCLKPWPKAGG